jgi:hypothetical protein
LEFAKTKSIVTVQRTFRTMYHTEPPTNKTVLECYMKFQDTERFLIPCPRTQKKKHGKIL